MNLGNLRFGEILIILVILLLLFGAKRIPEIAGSIGKGITEFKRNLTDAQRQITEPPPRTEQRIAQNQSQPAERNTSDEDRPEPKRLLN